MIVYFYVDKAKTNHCDGESGGTRKTSAVCPFVERFVDNKSGPRGRSGPHQRRPRGAKCKPMKFYYCPAIWPGSSFFIVSGILKITSINHKGNHVTQFFLKENQFCMVEKRPHSRALLNHTSIILLPSACFFLKLFNPFRCRCFSHVFIYLFFCLTC